MKSSTRAPGPILALALLVSASTTLPAQTTPSNPDAGLASWWSAPTQEARSQAAAQIERSGTPFQSVYDALAAGRTYGSGPDIPRGTLEKSRTNSDGFLHRYVLRVPDGYDPSRSYPVRFYLHGGVSRPDPGRGGGWARNLDRFMDGEAFLVAPLAWSESLWWQARQVENLHGILDELKRTYNIDENRVHLMGVSDGGTGVYFLAFHDPTPWSSFLPFIGSPEVLMNPTVRADGELHVGNLKNRPLFIVNGEQDRLYPVSSVRPWLSTFDAANVTYEFRPQPGGHDTSWWPSESQNIERFITEHPRDPHPESLVWGTESADLYPRAHWIVIDDVGEIRGDMGRVTLGMWAANLSSGMVWATREDNTVNVLAYRVRSFRVLLSPDEFDLTRPVRIEVNGAVEFEGVVTPSVETLLEWAGRDMDRTMLYAAEVVIEPGR
jgi:predicted esterase